MKIITLLLSLNILLLAVCTSSNTNPGFLYNKPNIHALIPNVSTLLDVEAVLGEPAVSQMSFRKQLTYKYYYNLPNAKIDTGLMIKGNYSDGCKGCGEIVVTFKWGNSDNFKDFVLTNISRLDEQTR
ncbi:MAG: hypothetical protein Q8J85_12970 [Sulfuricurvum sp.]|nr:hypothetical protein [Sulfuricurvum sp.]MDP3022780.1 hypothetical protein [Sulfuricurvum sp.]